MATKMTVKGQVTIPKLVREAAGIGPGDLVEVLCEQGTIKVKKCDPKSMYRAKINTVRGMLDLGMSVDDYMNMVRGDA